jgi:hypothetical protein
MGGNDMRTFKSVAALALVFAVSLAVESLIQKASHPLRVHAAAPIALVPATVYFHETVAQGWGDHISGAFVSRRGIYALRSDGAYVQQQDSYNREGKLFNSTRTLELPGGIQAEVEDLTKVLTVVQSDALAQAHLNRRFTVESDCAGRAGGNGYGAPQQHTTDTNVLGIKALGFRIDNPSMVDETWRSPEAGCLEVKRTVYFKNPSGQITDSSIIDADEVVRGEPARELFSVPDSYERVNFSERYRRAVALTRDELDPATLARLAAVDLQYVQIAYKGRLQ